MRTAAIAAVIGFASAWYVQGLRWDNDVAQAKVQHSTRALNSVATALDNWQTQNQLNEAAYAKLDQSLIALRGTVGGLRGDFKELPGFVRSASRESLADYASTCTAIFERMADVGAEMGHAGARIARQADAHAADANALSK